MLRLVNVKKDYPAGSGLVHALKGITLSFRKSEFVSILGPSGCGKTTMLNIIGGLDSYTEGDLTINGRSTKSYNDRDWDTYRNHSIGFVFQTYNLIPHQTVLGNVELALTLSGVSKSERRKRAKRALEEVGLGDQFDKRPSQLSGGQMQRVAIARALVNDPEIILADEPTGALDTETSVQIMEILKKISEKKLIIMVTHNPELAKRYSTRIINMLDGEITGDSLPPSDDELVSKEKKDSGKKPSMSFFTAFSLSLRNLFTKKGRTILTSFAGSIGIIGIALIYAVSHGMTQYINTVQEETLSSYPIVIEEMHMDMSELLDLIIGSSKTVADHDADAVYQRSSMFELVNSLTKLSESKNDLKSFKKYIEDARNDENDQTGLRDALNGVRYAYGLNLSVYTENEAGKIIRSDANELLRSYMRQLAGRATDENNNQSRSGASSGNSLLSLFSNNSNGNGIWSEMVPGEDGELVNRVVRDQYEIYGSWPENYDEIVVVIDKYHELDDMTLYALGLRTREELDEMMKTFISGKEVEFENKKWSYEEILGRDFRVVINSDVYAGDGNRFVDMSMTEAGLRLLYNNALKLKVVGVIWPSEDSVASNTNGGVRYTHALTEYVIKKAEESEVVKAQKNAPYMDVLTDLPFKEASGSLSDEEKKQEFIDYIEKIGEKTKAEKYVKIKSIAPDEYVENAVSASLSQITAEQLRAMMIERYSEQVGTDTETVKTYIDALDDEQIVELAAQLMRESVKAEYAANVTAQLSQRSESELAALLNAEYLTYTDEQYAVYYDEALEFSPSSYENNLKLLGAYDLDSPSAIYLYASSFEGKNVITAAIDKYNEGKEDVSKISYTDIVGRLLSSVTTIIDAITYVLIAFVAISLVVSSIMIGVITLISVQERTKEIGILRSIGASKRDVSRLFNAETMIIGFTSGAFGVIVTYLLIIILNVILHALTGIKNLNASLPASSALILILVSMGLTLFSGIIPSRSASKKDPVIALRTE